MKNGKEILKFKLASSQEDISFMKQEQGAMGDKALKYL